MKKLKTRKWLRWTLLVFFVGAITAFSIVSYIRELARPLIFSNIDSVPSRYVAVIFGAGIYTNGKPSKYLKDRLDAGISLYRAGKVKRILVSGDNGTKNYDELTVMKNYCAAAGVPQTDIFVDYAGFDTYSTVYRAKDLFKVTDAIMVSQDYHLSRAIFLGKEMGIDAVGYAADKGQYKFALKNEIREQMALVKSFLDAKRHRKPKFYGGDIDIHGASNFDKK